LEFFTEREKVILDGIASVELERTNTSAERFMVLVIRYKETHEILVDKFLKEMEKKIIKNHGEVRRSYHGSDDRIVSALEKVLDLADEP